jgi:S1-C subfamily serine protease
VGKSSVLQAGVLPHLGAAASRAVVYFNEWQSAAFLSELTERCRQAAASAIPDGVRRLDDALEQAGRFFLLLDQFEEYLLYHDEGADQEFDAILARIVNRDDVPAKVLIGIREDALSKLDQRFGIRIPNLLGNTLVVEHLDAPAAREAIRRPLEVFNKKYPAAEGYQIEPKLVEEILRQVRAGQVAASESAGLGSAAGRAGENDIETAFLQLVLMRLWSEEARAGSRTLRLETLSKIGGAGSIVQKHVAEVMAQFRSNQERDIAVGIFRYLVTPSRTKIAQSTPDLVSFGEAPAADVMNLLSSLTDRSEARILRRLANPERYEIFHDVLAQPILEWRRAYLVQKEHAAEQERQAAEAERQRHDLEQTRALARAEQRRAEAEARSARRLRGMLAGVLVALLMAAIAAIFAFEERQQAVRQRQEALKQRQEALEATKRAFFQRTQAEAAKATALAAQKEAEAARAQLLGKTAEAESLRAQAREFSAEALQANQQASALKQQLSALPLTAAQIFAGNIKSVILIEVTWKITDPETGAQLYLFHLQNRGPYCPEVGESEYLPVFVEDSGKPQLLPVLSTLSNDGHNIPIVSAYSGSGFIVGGEGLFLTNRHVLTPWRSVWNTAEFMKAPQGIIIKNGSIVGCISASQFPSAWVPAEAAKYQVDQNEADKIGSSGRLEASPLHTSVHGEAVYNVTFPKTMQRYRATIVTLSAKHDVALGKVELPGGGQPVTLFTDESAIQPGQPVVVMGYPAIYPSVFGIAVSRDMFTNRSHVSAIADPTLTTGPISKVAGEVFQLGINTTNAGNDGGPVFDSKGRVIAVFYARGSLIVAVPIKFGKELIDNPVQ